MQVSWHRKGQVIDQGVPKTEGATPIFETEIWVQTATGPGSWYLYIHIRRPSVGWRRSSDGCG